MIPGVAGPHLDQSAVVDEVAEGASAEMPAGCRGFGGILREGVSSQKVGL